MQFWLFDANSGSLQRKPYIGQQDSLSTARHNGFAIPNVGAWGVFPGGLPTAKLTIVLHDLVWNTWLEDLRRRFPGKGGLTFRARLKRTGTFGYGGLCHGVGEESTVGCWFTHIHKLSTLRLSLANWDGAQLGAHPVDVWVPLSFGGGGGGSWGIAALAIWFGVIWLVAYLAWSCVLFL